MSERKMKVLRRTCIAALASAITLFAIAVLIVRSESDGKNGMIVHASSYSDAASTDIMDASGNMKLKTQVCGHCGGTAYVIESERQLAAVFKFAYEERYLSNCYFVNFTPSAGYMDMRKSSGWDANFLAIGRTEATPYTGCFDFNGLTVYTDFSSNAGLFPYMKNGYVGNLNFVHTGYATLISNTSNGSRIDNVDAEVTVSGENLLTDGSTQVNALIAYIVNGNENTGVFSCDVRMNAGSAVTLKDFAGIVYSHQGGVISGCTFVYPTSDVTFGYSVFNGGIAAGSTGIAIERCKVTIPSEGTKTLAQASYGSNFNFGGIVAYTNRAGIRISDCEVNIEIDACTIKSDMYGYTNKNLGVGGILGRCNSYAEITGCRVVGTNFYGLGKTGGILGATNTTFIIRDCSVFFSGRFRGGQDTGGIFGGNAGASNAENIIDGCEVVMNEIWAGRCSAGIAGTFRSGWGKITKCNVYVNTLYSDNDWIGAFIGFSSSANNYFENTHAYIKTYSMRAAGTTDESGLKASRSSISYLATSVPGITAKGVTYTTDVSGTLQAVCGTDTKVGTVTGDATQLTGKDYNNAVAEIAEKLKQKADEAASPPAPDVSGTIDYAYGSIKVRFAFRQTIVNADYRIESLYLSVAGAEDKSFTQLIYAGSVVGYLGSDVYSIGDTNIKCSAAGFDFEYAAVPTYLTAIQLKITLKDAAGGLRSYAIDAFGTTELAI